MDALLEVPNVAYILGLQEASVVAMADGYAQAARRPGFLNLHTAGGLGHGMGNLLNASVSQTPLVVTAGQQDSRHTISDPLLFGDLVQIARPAVKWAQEVAHADQLPVLLRRAFHDSMAAPAGPVFLSLPMDVMEEMSGVDIGTPSVINRAAVAGGLEDLAEALTSIAPGRIALIAGDEVYASDAAVEVAAVAECLGAPVYGSSWPSRVPFSTAHPLWCGNLPTQATAIAERLSAYDAIFALGGKSLITILYTEGPALPPGCAVYQMSSDVRDLGRTFNTPLSVVGDIKASLQALLPLLGKAANPHQADYAAQAEQVAAARRAQRRKRLRKQRPGGMRTPSRRALRHGRLCGLSGLMWRLWMRPLRRRPTSACFSKAHGRASIPFCVAVLWGGECLPLSGRLWGLGGTVWSRWWGMGQHSILRRPSGPPRMKNFLSRSSS